MASREDSELLRHFLVETVTTYGVVVERANLLRSERGLLQPAIEEAAQQIPALVRRYARQNGVDAGLVGLQLRAKVELATSAGQRLLRRRGRLPTRAVRRWLKRVRLLVGSLKTLVPGAEALEELLDLLDAALDR